ncbi:MAG: flagellar basal body P-ring protein FlgI [Sedimentisphaerales bacterium]
MKFYLRKALWCVTLVLLLAAFGCGGPGRRTAKNKSAADNNGIDDTIGMYAEIFASDAIPISGYGLVGGLNGTGSSECPTQIRTYLQKYILQRLAGAKVNVEDLISSPDTAVVIVEGVIPPAASKNQRFDVRVTALPGTQTTSLEGGWLYGVDLFETRQVGMGIKPLATAEGPVFTDSAISGSQDPRTGYVLGGGTVVEEYKVNLALRLPDYRIVSQIRNRINERFGYEIAVALAPGSIELRIPTKYLEAKGRFIQLVRATYLVGSPELTEKRIMTHIEKLAGSKDKNASEIALEAIGNAAMPKLAALLNSSDPEVRLRAARCMFNLGNQKGREALWGIATDKESSYRIEAIDALVNTSAGQDVTSMLQSLLRDDDLSVRLIAYENLVRLKDVTVSRKLIANSFYLDQVTQTGKPAILVSRRIQPRIALLGSPIYCRSNIFIETQDGTITINVPAGEKYATIIRKHPRRPDTIIQLKSSLDLADVIETLCREPLTPTAQGGPGLGVPYSTLVGLISKMVDSGAIQAEFYAGPLPKTLPNIKK